MVEPIQAGSASGVRKPGTPNIYQVQILRFVASGMVLFGHIQHEIADQSFIDKTNFKPFEPVFWPGGVDIFFVISGFIMYYLCHQQFGRPGASAQFLWRRLLRVAPPYWFFTIAMLAAMWLFSDIIRYATPSVAQIVGSFLFLPLPDPYGHSYPILILGWTLNFEMLFYAIFAIGMLFSRKVGLTVIFAILAILGVLPFLVTVQVPVLKFWANSIVFEFLFGILIAHLRLSGYRVSSLTGWAIFLAGIAVMAALKYAGIVNFVGSLRLLVIGLPAFLVVCGPALIRESDDTQQSWLTRALVFGGDSSYALYLSHPFAINLIALVAIRSNIHDPWLYIATAATFSLIVAGIFYFVMERPVTSWLNRRLGNFSTAKSTSNMPRAAG